MNTFWEAMKKKGTEKLREEGVSERIIATVESERLNEQREPRDENERGQNL